MSQINKPEGLPDCKIINTLIEKANTKTDYEFSYAHQLEQVRNKISIEVSRINLLFPEYTPHDEKYHLRRLFHVADQILGDEIIESMNVTELFLLSLSLYAHDWGMAISDEEKKYILNNYPEQPSNDINLLDNEKQRISDFCRKKNIELKDIESEDWQEYIRITHAFRSGKRIKTYFDPISSGVAEFAARICEGHWLDFDIIDDHTSYPTDAAIHRDIVNVKALTIYVRLIDLLDIGEDRTPFILWKFVAPRNKFSKLEWSKHRALQPVTFPTYQLARYIQVDGSTDDQNVYMSIMDLKRYVDEQFRKSSDILNRINHSYHKLDISHIDWRIAARGFEPVAIQFEFDRNRMFEILGDEIYKSNPYVFIRELLQNAIDAIEMRTEILDSKNLSFKPKIKLEISEDIDHYKVQITDNGIGMDEYIIRNYLAVAGKSYYRSLDFQREGLKMDPISRFGIGVLSCFMVAEYIEIETYKDPNTTQKQEHISVSIPSKENYFKISKNKKNLEIGTTFNVFVIKNKLPKNKDNKEPISFNITSYIKKIAGFVKYPITIRECGIESLVANPNEKIAGDVKSFMVDYNFPIEKAFKPQNVETVKEYFMEKKIHLKTDLKLENFDGCITYLIPKYDSLDILNDSHTWPTNDVIVVDYKKELKARKKIQWENEWISFSRYDRTSDKNIIPDRSYSVYMDGILLQEITPPEITSENYENDDDERYNNEFTESFVSPQLMVNIPKPPGMKIDLARTNIETKEKWDTQIWFALFAYLKNTIINEIMAIDAKQKLMAISKLITFYQLTPAIIIEKLIDCSKLPTPFLIKGGIVKYQEINSETQSINLLSRELGDEFYNLFETEYVEYKKYQGILNQWNGAAILVMFKNLHYVDRVPSSLMNINALMKSIIRRQYYLSSIIFITSPSGDKFPLIQEVLKRIPSQLNSKKTILNLDVTKLSEHNLSILNSVLKDDFLDFPTLINFPAPFESKALYSFKYLNYNNKIFKALSEICIYLIKDKKEKKLSDIVRGKVSDLINDLPFVKFYYSDEDMRLSDLNNKLNEILTEARINGIIDNKSNFEPKFSFTDFVENSITVNKAGGTYNARFNAKKYLKGKQLWGSVIL